MNAFISYRPAEQGGVWTYNGTHQGEIEQLRAQLSTCLVFPLPADFSTDTYTIENGKLVKANPELIAERLAVKAKAAASVEIAELRAYLTQTDYAPIKCGELGLSMAEIYPELHAQRTAARARINLLQEGGAE